MFSLFVCILFLIHWVTDSFFDQLRCTAKMNKATRKFQKSEYLSNELASRAAAHFVSSVKLLKTRVEVMTAKDGFSTVVRSDSNLE